MMNTKLSVVKTIGLVFGTALLTAGVALSILSVPRVVQAGTDLSLKTIANSDSALLAATKLVTDTYLKGRDLIQGDAGAPAVTSASPAVPASTYQVTNNNTSGPGSLYQAILNANANAGADTITFAANVSGTIVLTGSLPAIADTLTIIGPGANVLAISGANAYGVLTINTGIAVTIIGLTIRDGNASGGGGINSAGTLIINNTNIVSNTAGYGGGVYQGGSGRVDVISSLIEFNHSGNQGGGLYINGDVALTNTLVLTNTAGADGGGLTDWAGRTDLTGGMFAGNSAGGNGGGINVNNSVSINGTQFISNTAANGGGLLQWNAGYTVTVTNARFERNTAKNKGGGAYISSTLTLSNSVFVANTVDSGNANATAGGGLYAGNVSQIFATTFAGNGVNCNGCGYPTGGGLYSVGNSATLTNVTFSGNQAYGNTGAGGGMYSESGNFTMNNATFKGNQAGGWGGGLYAFSNNVTLSNAIFSGNKAFYGGGIFNVGGNRALINSTFSGNSAAGGGSGMSSLGSSTLLVNSIVWANGGDPQIQGISGGTFAITYSDIQGTNVYTGTGNINADPQFVAPITSTAAPTTTGDYHLLPASPAINVGTNTGLTMDLDGVTRPQGNNYDMGAYEARISLGPCHARLLSNSTTYTSTDAAAIQVAVDAAAPGDTVKVAGTCAGVQTRTGISQTIYISKSLILRGGYTTTNWLTSNPIAYPTLLDAQQAGRVIYLMGGSDMSVTLDSLSVSNGKTTDVGGGILNNLGVLYVSNTLISENNAYMGGGIRNEQGTLMVVNSVLANNSSSYWGGGIANYSGTLRVSNSTFTGNTSSLIGGGIADNGYLTVTNSTLVGNSAQRGGGMFVYWGQISVTNSTLSGNSSTQSGAFGGGGAIEYLFNPTPFAATLTNRHDSERASGSAHFEVEAAPQSALTAPSASMLNCTIVSNTAAITNISRSSIWLEGGTLDIGNSIIAQNGVTNNVVISGGTLTSLGYNLTNSGTGTPFTATTDLSNTNPLLGPLQDNGGSNWTHALLPGSPAIDHIPFGVTGCGTSFTTDQRGQPRPGTYTHVCDIGAYEAQGIRYQIYLPLIIK